MILSFENVLNYGQKEEIEALITTEHPKCVHKKPVIILSDGNLLDHDSYVLMGYRLIQASEDESALFEKWLKNSPPVK